MNAALSKLVLAAENSASDAALKLCRASDALEAIDALVNVSISVLRSGADLADNLAVVLDSAYEKIVTARGEIDSVLNAMGGAS
jgi:hypothetical protein